MVRASEITKVKNEAALSECGSLGLSLGFMLQRLPSPEPRFVFGIADRRDRHRQARIEGFH